MIPYQQIFESYRPWFKTRPVVLRAVDASTDWYGMFLPGPKSDTILLNLDHADTERLVRGTLLHELIHAEQMRATGVLDHGAYFQLRAAELRRRTGLPI